MSQERSKTIVSRTVYSSFSDLLSASYLNISTPMHINNTRRNIASFWRQNKKMFTCLQRRLSRAFFAVFDAMVGDDRWEVRPLPRNFALSPSRSHPGPDSRHRRSWTPLHPKTGTNGSSLLPLSLKLRLPHDHSGMLDLSTLMRVYCL